MPDGFAGRYEVLEDREAGRRTWPTDVKLRIVAESHAPGVMVSEVARRHRLMPSQVTTWRRLHREGKLGPADTFETVNTLGQPLYARTIPDRDRDEWVRLEIESNPLPICTRPQVLRSARRT